MSNDSLKSENRTYAEKGFIFLKQLIVTLLLHKTSYEFIRENRPWQGLKQYRWITAVFILSAVLLGWQFFNQILELLISQENTGQFMSAGFSSMIENLPFDKMEWALHGGKKYLVLLVLEIITFHFVRQVLQFRTGIKTDSSIGAFLRTEVRMIKVSLIAWLMETIIRGLFNLGLGILGLHSLKYPVGLAVQFYFLGFLLIDNYMECFGWTIRESEKYCRKVAGVAVATGMVVYVLLYVPLVGVVLATMLGAVTAALAMERFAPEIATEGIRKTKNKIKDGRGAVQ